MLLRVVVAVEGAVERRRMLRLLKGLDVDCELVKGTRPRWEDFLRRAMDMLVVSEGLIPDPVESEISRVSELERSPGVVVLTGRDDVSQQAGYRAAGADAVLYQEVPDPVLSEALRTVIDLRTELETKAVAARRAISRPSLDDFITASPSMASFVKTARQVAESDVPLLVLGETGAGKERLARAVHGASRRADGPFISVNCGAIPESLIESELFGHEEGAFTGATRTRRGCFVLAHRGSLFLDEICEMPLNLQVKLLHALQDFEIRAVGSERSVPVDVRVIAATNRDVVREVSANRFRADLYYRLSVVTLEVPPLRRRAEDIPALAEGLIRDLSARIGSVVRRIDAYAMQTLCTYAWPGNVRELINVLERAVLLCEADTITMRDLPDEIAGARLVIPPENAPVQGIPTPPPHHWQTRSLKDVRRAAVHESERAFLDFLLRESRGRIGITAERAGIGSRALYTKMKRYGLCKEDYKTGIKM